MRLHAHFHIDAWVVLPDHMHCLWTLPAGDADFPGRWRAINTAFSNALPAGEPRSPAMSSRGERGIWQRRYWEHTIRDDRDFAALLDYTHFNAWSCETSRRLVVSSMRGQGAYPTGWIGGNEQSLETGERRRSNFDDCISFDQELPGVHCFAPIDQRNHALH